MNRNLKANKNNALYQVYILANRDQTKIPRRTKIGIAIDPHARIKGLRLDKISYRGFEDLYVYAIYNIDNPVDLEKAAHIWFKDQQCKDIKGFDGYTEFFDVHPDLVHRFMVKAGAKIYHKPT